MKRPDISSLDKRQKEYVEYLEKKCEMLNNDTALVDSYLALKNFVIENNKVIKVTKLSEESLKGKDEKYVDRVMKYTDKLGDYIDTLYNFEMKIDEKCIPVNDKKEKQGASVYEQALMNARAKK